LNALDQQKMKYTNTNKNKNKNKNKKVKKREKYIICISIKRFCSLQTRNNSKQKRCTFVASFYLVD